MSAPRTVYTPFTTMRIVITGASGFVGQKLINHMHVQGLDVLAAVRNTAAPSFKSQIVGEIGAHTDWQAALEGADCVVHLAARVHRLKDPNSDELAAHHETNTLGTLMLAKAAAKASVRRLVFLSTAKVLGESSPTSGFDDRSAPAPTNPYSISKWEAEQALHEVSRTSGLEVCVLRPPLVYGPGVRANFLRLLRWVDRGYPLPFGAIDNRRSLIALENLVDAITVCATHPDAAGGTFLVSDGEAISTAELVRLLAEELHRPARLIPMPVGMLRVLGSITGRSAEIDRLAGDFVVHDDGIRSALHWRPPLTMQEAMAQTMAWYRGLGGTE